MTYTLRKAAQAALDVQTACNLSGVVHSFAEITHWMRQELKFDTPTCNTHPICRLFAEQISHLTGAGMGDGISYLAAAEACRALAAPCPICEAMGPKAPAQCGHTEAR